MWRDFFFFHSPLLDLTNSHGEKIIGNHCWWGWKCLWLFQAFMNQIYHFDSPSLCRLEKQSEGWWSTSCLQIQEHLALPENIKSNIKFVVHGLKFFFNLQNILNVKRCNLPKSKTIKYAYNNASWEFLLFPHKALFWNQVLSQCGRLTGYTNVSGNLTKPNVVRLLFSNYKMLFFWLLISSHFLSATNYKTKMEP